MFWNLYLVFFIFGYFLKKHRTFSKISRSVSKLHFTCPEKHLVGEMVLFRKNYRIFFTSKQSLSQRLLNFCREKIRQRCQKAILPIYRTFCGYLLHTLYLSSFFRHWTKNLWTFDGNFFLRDFKTTFHLSIENCFCFFFIFYHFWVLFKNSSNLYRKIPVKLHEKTFCMSRTTFWGKRLFENFI